MLEKKTILNFLSQGAVGGAIGYLLLTAFVVVYQPSGYNFMFLIILPVTLVVGSAFGSVTAIFVWLPGVLLKRRLGFVARVVMATAAVLLLSFASSYLTDEANREPWPLFWVIPSVCAMSFPVALMTGSRLRPCRLIVLGAGLRSTRYNFGSWLSIPVGFVLRVASIFGLLEALMTLTLWISNRRGDSSWSPSRETLPAIVLAVLYFCASTYFSIRTPRKFFLLPTAILMNLPLAFLTLNLRGKESLDSIFLVYTFLVFICLWMVYTLGRLIAPESAPGVVDSPSKAQGAQKLLPGRDYQVLA